MKKTEGKKLKLTTLGFTLVELLAVIVILAVILIIAVPQIMSVIESARKGSIESTAKLIAEGAEREYTNRKILGKDTNIKCSDVSSMNSNDYGTCSISFDNAGKATVTITGKGKFEGYTCKGNSTNMECTKKDTTPTDASYFTYSDAVDQVVVKDKDKCISYLTSIEILESDANIYCSGNEVNGWTLKGVIQEGGIPSSDYEIAGMEVTYDGIVITGYNVGTQSVEVKDKDKCVAYLLNLFDDPSDEYKENANTLCSGKTDENGYTIEDLAVSEIPPEEYENVGLGTIYKNGGGTDMVIPSMINGKKVTGIGATAFAGNITTNDGKYYYYAGLGLTSVVIPNTIANIWESAFEGNQLTSITFPSTPLNIYCRAFAKNPITNDGTYTYPSNVTMMDCPES